MRTNCPCDWRRAIFLRNDPATVQSRVDIILFSLPASDLSKRPPSDGQRGRQDRLFGLTGQAIYDLVPVRSNFLHKGYTMTGKERQARSFIVGTKMSTHRAKKMCWREQYHTQFSRCRAG